MRRVYLGERPIRRGDHSSPVAARMRVPCRLQFSIGVNGLSEPYAWVVDGYPYREGSTIFGVRLRDGVIVVRTRMTGQVRRNILPLVHKNVLYVPAYDGEGGSWLEAYAIRPGG